MATLKPPTLVLKPMKSKSSHKPKFNPSNNKKITDMFKKIPPKKIPPTSPSRVTSNAQVDERVPPIPPLGEEIEAGKPNVCKLLASACYKNNICNKLGVSSDIRGDDLAPIATKEITDYPHTSTVNPDTCQEGQDLAVKSSKSSLYKGLGGKGRCQKTSGLADQESV